MTKDYGRPPRADENCSLIERRLKEVAAGVGTRETLTVDWRGQPAHLDVILVSVGSLYYNPATHRIRAQRSHDTRRDELLEEAPWDAESQEYLDRLLKVLPADPSKEDPDFALLLDSLKGYGQTDPGLISRDGVLVNGNTRRAALLQLRGPDATMRVAVLPESCDWADIRDVELSLQLRKDHRREYSYINRLLAIEELTAQGKPPQEIASIFRTTPSSLKQDQWALSCIKSMIDRSDGQGIKLPMVAFEDQTEKLRELNRRYAKEQAVNPERAELIKESRLAAMMLGFSKTDVRLIESDFQRQYLAARLPDKLQFNTSTSVTVTIPGLNRTVKGDSAELASAKSLTDMVLKARAAELAPAEQISPEVKEAASREVVELHKAVEKSLDFAGKDQRIRKRKQAAPERIVKAQEEIDQCVTDLVMSRASRSLDDELFDEAVVSLRQSLRKLAVESKRTIAEPGDGVAWLIDVLLEKS